MIEAREALHQAQETLQNEQQRGRQQEAELGESKAVLEKEKRRVTRIWREKCDLQLSHKDAMDAKDVEIARLKARLLVVTSPAAVSPQTVPSPGDRRVDETSLVPLQRGKAPPIDPFSAEGLDEQWDEWLPTFERAAEWNNWSDTECLLQLAGHLGGKARQEFSLLTPEEKSTFTRAKAAVRSRLEVGSKTLAAQDFRHATQGSQEAVSDYIIRLEKIFRRAYGQDHMAEETRNALLYAQLQEGLKYVLMKASAVSGAQGYQELRVAARNEERHLNEVSRRQQYLRESAPEPGTDS